MSTQISHSSAIASGLPLALLHWLSLFLQLAMPIGWGLEHAMIFRLATQANFTSPEGFTQLELASSCSRMGQVIGFLGLMAFWIAVFLARVQFHARWIFWFGIAIGAMWLLLASNFWGLVTIVLFVLMQNRFRDLPWESAMSQHETATGLES